MKKKLTVNTLALGNLKHRRKQYIIMIIGIILAMVFSSSIVLFMFSAYETNAESNKKHYGDHSIAYATQELTDKDYKQAVKDDILESYGYMHNIGYAYRDKDSKYLGAAVTWMDDTADQLYYLTLLEGKKPTAENEIAIEKTVLKKLGYKESKVGDTIKLKLDVANGMNFGKSVEKEYTIVGIYDDRKSYIEELTYDSSGSFEYDTITPGIYVAKDSKVELGGKELKIAVLNANEDATYYSEKEKHTYHSDLACYMYFSEIIEADLVEKCGGGNTYRDRISSLDVLFDGGSYLAIIIVVLVFASCISIINAFNTNLKERKKQIGMLRAVGTTKRQIINIFGREAFIISLIATPISLAVSYAIVRIVLTIIGNGCVMSKSLWAIAIAAILDIIVVMLAALIPLFFASRTTPMQAIRNMDTNRKAKNKKIVSKKSFTPASHIAKRNTKFYKGGIIAVSIMLTVTICFSCVAFSFVSHEADNIMMYPHDYQLANMSGEVDAGVNSDQAFAMTEVERQNIAALPYVKNTYGIKNIHCAVELDEVTDFIKILDYQTYEYTGDYVSPTSNEEFKNNLKQTAPKDYVQTKKELKIKKEMVQTVVTAYDKGDLNKISHVLTDGEIDYDKLASGEEVILVCPQRAELVANISNRLYAVDTVFDNNVGKHSPKYEHIMQAESPFKVGDELNLCIATYHYDKENDQSTIKSIDNKTVKIGAIVSPEKLGYYNVGVSARDFSVLTSISGMNAFKKNVPYDTLSFDVNEEIDDDLDEKITEDMSNYTEKYNGFLDSAYHFSRLQKKGIQQAIVAVIALVIIGFAICISIINNSISAQIRENKRVIGTLRAVGADRRELSKSYIYQMLSMFGWGTGFGYGLFLIILATIKIATLKTGGNFVFSFNPWITIAMTVISFAICSINVVTKIRKEMKNSIVENIREL